MTGRWFDRRFAAVDPALLPQLLERLRGTPARLEERLRGVTAETARRPDGDRWSIQTNVGHLGDLEPLWLGRVDDFASARATLRPADLDNRATHAAGHDRAALTPLLASFRQQRARLVAAIEALDETARRATATHPRLGTPMGLADLAAFVAEHDDHHLARIGELLPAAAAGAAPGSQLLLVLERFRPGCAAAVYRRARERGRLLPDGLRYRDSWVDLPIERCFQLMETERPELLQQWIAEWVDLVEFEVVPVQTSAAAAAAMAAGS